MCPLHLNGSSHTADTPGPLRLPVLHPTGRRSAASTQKSRVARGGPHLAVAPPRAFDPGRVPAGSTRRSLRRRCCPRARRAAGRGCCSLRLRPRVVRSQNSSAGPDSEYSCGSCRFSPRVAMMKSADPRQSDDFGIRGLSSLRDSPHWRVSEAGVDSIFVVE